MREADYESNVDCFINDCGGDMYILLDGTAVCKVCGFTETQWTEPPQDEPIENAIEYQGYVDGIAEYVHCGFHEWYEDYIKLLDVYYKRVRGWPSEDAKLKFHDLCILAPVKFVQLMEKRTNQLKNKMRKQKRDIADRVNKPHRKGV